MAVGSRQVVSRDEQRLLPLFAFTHRHVRPSLCRPRRQNRRRANLTAAGRKGISKRAAKCQGDTQLVSASANSLGKVGLKVAL